MDEQLREELEALNRTLNGLGASATDAEKKFRDAGDRLFKVKGAGDQLQKSLDSLADATKKLTSTIYQGQASASSYGEAVSKGADAVGDFAAKFGIWGKIIGGALSLFGKYIGAATKQADQLYKGFQDLNKMGAATSMGFTDIRENLKSFRYGIEEIDKMVRLVGTNAPALAMFGGNVAKGTKAVAQMAQGITRSDLLEQFMNMGISLDEINENAFAYAALQARIGGLQNKTQAEATASLKNYIQEVDAITRLTGMSRKEQEDARNRALAIDAFRREQEEIMRTGTDEQKANAKKQLETFVMLSSMGEDGKRAAVAFAQMRRGYITEGDALNAAMLTGTDAFNIAMDDSLSAAEKAQAFAKSLGTAADSVGGAAADVNRFSQIFGFSYGGLKDMEQASRDLAKRLEGVTDEQQRAKIIQEENVKRMTNMNIANLDARDNMQDFVALGLKPATYALQALSYVVEKLTRLLPGSTPSRAQQANEIAQRKAEAGGAGFFGQMFAGAKAGLSATLGGAAPGTMGSIRDMIAKVESGGDYNVLVGGGRADLEKMTLAEVFALQQEMLKSGKESTAVGRYQFTAATLARMAKKLGMDPSTTKFDRGTQDRLADALIDEMGYQRYAMGTLSREDFLKNLSTQWAGLPKDASGASYYAGVGSNKAGIGYEQALASLADGGVVAGPKSGFMAQLHGTEAVVPLPDGRTIPVSMPDISNGMQAQVAAMSEQISKLDELVSLMRNQNAISTRILQSSTA